MIVVYMKKSHKKLIFLTVKSSFSAEINFFWVKIIIFLEDSLLKKLH
jgi:hypothetical protein